MSKWEKLWLSFTVCWAASYVVHAIQGDEMATGLAMVFTVLNVLAFVFVKGKE